MHFFVQARQLENQIDTKLASLGKLGTNFSKSSSGSAKTPLLAGDESSNQSAFESLSTELSQLLGRLSEVGTNSFHCYMHFTRTLVVAL